MIQSVRVHGLREVTAAFRKVDTALVKSFGEDLKKAAEPVAETARGKVTRYKGAKVTSIRTKRSSGTRVFVEQGAKKVTGKRGDFGSLQMRTVLIPALEENRAKVFSDVAKLIDGYGADAGF